MRESYTIGCAEIASPSGISSVWCSCVHACPIRHSKASTDRGRDIVDLCAADAKRALKNIMTVVCCKGFAPAFFLDHKRQKRFVISEDAWLDYASFLNARILYSSICTFFKDSRLRGAKMVVVSEHAANFVPRSAAILAPELPTPRPYQPNTSDRQKHERVLIV